MRLTVKNLLISSVAIMSLPIAQACAVKSGLEQSHDYYNYAFSSSRQSVIDLNTGLMWQRCANGQTYNTEMDTCTGSATAYATWFDALNSLGAINTQSLDGFGDWRIPNANELTTLIDTGCVSPAINALAFPNAPASLFYSNTPTRSKTAAGTPITAGDGITIPFYFGSGSSVKNLRLVRNYN